MGLGACLKIHPNHTAAVCTRRQAASHIYAEQTKLPQGVWWHVHPGERGKPGVLCAMSACGRGCLAFYKGMAHFQLQEWQAAAASLQEAHQNRYNPAQLFLAWGAAYHHLGSADGARQVWQAGLQQAQPKPTASEESQLRNNLLALQKIKEQGPGHTTAASSSKKKKKQKKSRTTA